MIRVNYAYIFLQNQKAFNQKHYVRINSNLKANIS